MAHLCILQPDARAEARISDAMGVLHRVTAARSWEELNGLVSEGRMDGCIVDADAPTREGALHQVRLLRARFPDLAVVVYADVHEADPELARMGGLGVDGVVLAGRPPWASGIRRAVERALSSASGTEVSRALADACPARAARAVGWAVEHAVEAPDVAHFAHALGHTSRSLAALLRRAGLPSPAKVLLWGRLLHAGALLGRDGRTVEDTALRLGYASASGLARAMKRETGRCPGEVASGGGLRLVLASLPLPAAQAAPRRREPRSGVSRTVGERAHHAVPADLQTPGPIP